MVVAPVGGGSFGKVWGSNRERMGEYCQGMGWRGSCRRSLGPLHRNSAPAANTNSTFSCCVPARSSLNLSPEVVSPQLWEPADLDSWEACGGNPTVGPWEATLLKGWGHLVRAPCMARTGVCGWIPHRSDPHLGV